MVPTASLVAGRTSTNLSLFGKQVLFIFTGSVWFLVMCDCDGVWFLIICDSYTLKENNIYLNIIKTLMLNFSFMDFHVCTVLILHFSSCNHFAHTFYFFHASMNSCLTNASMHNNIIIYSPIAASSACVRQICTAYHTLIFEPCILILTCFI